MMKQNPDLEINTSGIGLWLLRTRDGPTCQRDITPDNTILRPIAFASKSLTSTERGYSNIEREALGILHGLKRFSHYYFAREVSIITNHKPFVAIFKKDVATLSQSIQSILLRIHQSESGEYTSLDHISSLQIGFPDTTRQRTKM